MFLAEKYIIRSCRKAWKEGFAEGQAEAWAQWEPWLKRLEAAEAAGVEFTEPPPTRNKSGKTAKRKQTASAF